jgi:energy-coupling factor transport system permease protein
MFTSMKTESSRRSSANVIFDGFVLSHPAQRGRVEPHGVPGAVDGGGGMLRVVLRVTRRATTVVERLRDPGEHPLALAVVLAVEAGAAMAARLLRELRRMAAWGVAFALLVMAINALVSRQGATVVFRGPDLPWPGPLDITWEALAYGGVLGMRMLAIFGSATFLGAAVDADELLRGLRRASLRSGVTAALAVRLGPVLARDAQRLADAQKCLPGGGASRVEVLRAVTAGALDRATDVAATLEVRGFGVAARPPRTARPWSRHDIAFAASALVLAAFSTGVLAGAWATFEPYPRLSAPLGPATIAALAALVDNKFGEGK